MRFPAGVRAALLSGIAVLAAASSGSAQQLIIKGEFGNKGGVMPPPGLYAGAFGGFTWADELVGPDKNAVDGPSLNQHAFGPLVQYVSNFKLFGANYGALVAVPFANTAIDFPRLDVSGGIRRRSWQGAGIGFLAGAGVGAVVGLATYRRSDCGDSAVGQALVCPLIDGVSREVTVYGDALLIGSATAIVGALIGHRGHETWVPATVARVGDLRPRMEVRRVAGAVGLGATLDF